MNTPAHYTGTYEPWDFCEDLHLNSLEFNVVKYLVRAGRKGSSREDIDKALAYLDKLAKERRVDERLEALTRAHGMDNRTIGALVLTVCRQYDAAARMLRSASAPVDIAEHTILG